VCSSELIIKERLPQTTIRGSAVSPVSSFYDQRRFASSGQHSNNMLYLQMITEESASEAGELQCALRCVPLTHTHISLPVRCCCDSEPAILRYTSQMQRGGVTDPSRAMCHGRCSSAHTATKRVCSGGCFPFVVWMMWKQFMCLGTSCILNEAFNNKVPY